ncbi:erythromycin esterase family protein [Caulobacter sp. 602-2]|uniref:Erythromycin esterase family protein n=1 Tax=Caulobacter sp. 602-2 TaxID=2710887 RepID=A0A6G4R3A0_9CAUL|nr:erythromycin esterase family protein [Caulobacter sp. 602-2]NGM51965.1 erythromycin esterase family protein [Caulobacter sp. 602-2]
MNLKSTVAALALASLWAAFAHAETVAPPTFAERLAQAGSPLTVRPDGFAGPGAAILSEAVGDSRYVLIGESHFSREIPAFTTNVCRLMAPGGLTAMAVETGPEAAGAVNARMRAPDREQQISDFMRSHPDAMAFLNSRDEGRTAADCAGVAGPDFKLWGLDQEFLGASGYLFEQMLAAGPGPRARAQIEALAKQEQAATRAALTSGSPMDLFLLKADDATLDQAGTAIDQDGGDRAKALFAALRETRAIYQASQSRRGDPNGRRARLMKRTLATHLAEAPQARLLMKFGAYHLYKGYNPLGQRDLGNFVAERADGEGAKSLHIVVTGAKGEQAGYGGVGRQRTVRKFDATTGKDSDWSKDVMLARPSGTPQSDWFLVDLRPLRSIDLEALTPEWRAIIRGYDLAIVAPELSVSSVLGVQDAP